MLVVAGVSWDLNWFLQLIISFLVLVVGLHTLVKNTASRYFEVDANFEGDQHPPSAPMPGALAADDPICAVCATHATKKCSRCKAVRYCSTECQQSHWRSGHKAKCKDSQSGATNGGFKASAGVAKSSPSIALIPSCGSSGTSRPIKQPKDVLFPYNEFVKLFNWDKPGFPPCGLLNCGNSCFANVVLQCLSFTRPLVAYLLEKGHRRECSCNDWCFLCEFENHVERTRLSSQAFSPMNILSRLPNIGGTLGYGRQEDAHEFMRFSIDTMQSVCLDEFGGEKVVPPNLQETTLIQHIFGGRLQSEGMHFMTYFIKSHKIFHLACNDETGKSCTVTEFDWDVVVDNIEVVMCKDYVKAWKRLTVKSAPNILTIALKRFQSGRFGKLNKRIAFPETLNLSPYMSEAGDGSDIYKLYAVVVHIDMLNASFFGHYICYIKDFQGNWYRVDDSKVMSVELEDVLSQGAYMLLYSRCSSRPSGPQIQSTESSGTSEEVQTVEAEPGQTEQAECLSDMKTLTCSRGCEVLPSDISSEVKVSSGYEYESTGLNLEAKKGQSEDMDIIDVESTDMSISQAAKDLADVDIGKPLEETVGCIQEQDDTNKARSGSSLGLPDDFSPLDKLSSVSTDYQNGEDSEHMDVVKCKLLTAKDNTYYGNGYVSANKSAIPHDDTGTLFSAVGSSPTENANGNGVKKVELSADKS
ncbi:Zinc finger, MYND-type [Sesbania bispinosa]|nr:Zinc finger, MYND-type [Sesbania bispinosa]